MNILRDENISRLRTGMDPVGENRLVDIRQLIGPIRRHLGLVLSTIAIVVIFTAIVMFALTPKYTASALVVVDTSSKNLLDPGGATAASVTDNTKVESEVEILQSPAILAEVVERNELVTDEEFGARTGWHARILSMLRLTSPHKLSDEDKRQLTIERLSERISIRRLGSTYLIAVEVQSASAEKAANLANSIANTYIAAQVEAKVGRTLMARDILDKRIASGSDAIEQAESAFERFINENLERISQEGGSTALSDLRRKLQSARQGREQTLRAFEAIDESVRRDDWVSVATALQSEAIRQLAGQRQRIKGTIDASGPQATVPVNLRNELARIESEIQEQASLGKSSLRRRVESLDTDVDRIQQELRRTVLQGNLPTDLLTRLYQLQQDSEVARNQYQTLLSRLKDTEAQADLQIADSRLVSAALPPAKASFPKTGLIMILASLGAGTLGIALAFAYDNYIGGFLTEEQTAAVLRIPRVFPIPLQGSSKTGAGPEFGLADSIVKFPLSAYSEAIRRVWVAVEQMRGKRKERNGVGDRGPAFVVMVSSAVSGEGKTTLASSLARAFAMENRRTLLVDCDLRKPNVDKQLGVDVKVGLQDYLSCSPSMLDQLGGIIVEDTLSPLHLIVGRRGEERPLGTLLAGDNFQGLLSTASKNYDIIVLDTPPIGPVVDGLYIVQHADALVFSVQWAKTSQRDVNSALDAIAAARTGTLDVVCVLNKRGKDAFSQRGAYSDYYTED
ncbi:polysaccharide biosynthesis tyrosine autokinase [Mesorhizobium sp. WSM2239]|uniref:non-specific protein-tyrosine kinase n=2 Tax=unclassified Mesorhizobium TaxID=325217 RepID=A0AAU8DHR5_9HYPH